MNNVYFLALCLLHGFVFFGVNRETRESWGIEKLSGKVAGFLLSVKSCVLHFPGIVIVKDVKNSLVMVYCSIQISKKPFVDHKRPVCCQLNFIKNI